MALTDAQKLAQHEAAIARIKKRQRQRETGSKIVIGGVALALAREHDGFRQMLVKGLKERVKRDVDKKRVQHEIDELEADSASTASGQGPGQNPA